MRVSFSLSSFSAPNAAKRVADAISILTQRMKGPFALRRFFLVPRRSDRRKKGRTERGFSADIFR